MKDSNRRILFVANVAKEHIVKFHLPTIRKLKEEGWQVDVACFHDADVPDCDHQYDVSWNRSPFSFNTFKGILEMKQILKETHYDIVYCHTPVGGFVGRLGATEARRNGTKVVYVTHGFHFYENGPRKNWLIYYPIEKYLSHFSDGIITVNEEDYSLTKEKFSETKVWMIPGIGVDFSRLKVNKKKAVRAAYRQTLNIPEDAFTMIYVAELIPNKNQGMLLGVLKLLREKGLNVYLLLAGPDHYNGHLQRLAAKMGVTEYVRFLDWCNDIGQLMCAADVCTASSIREGFGINLIEAQYCGLPVIATNNRGHRMALKNGENGLLVEINDLETMAKFVEKIEQDEMFREQYSHVDVREYEANLIADRIYKILLEVL